MAPMTQYLRRLSNTNLCTHSISIPEQSCDIRATIGQISPNFQWMSHRVPESWGISNYKILSRSAKNYLQFKRKKSLLIHIICSLMKIMVWGPIILMCFLNKNGVKRVLFLKNNNLHKSRGHEQKI